MVFFYLILITLSCEFRGKTFTNNTFRDQHFHKHNFLTNPHLKLTFWETVILRIRHSDKSTFETNFVLIVILINQYLTKPTF